TVIELLPPPLPLWITGIGNSPPARKLAVSPDRATSVGSARVVITPFRSSASRVTLKFSPKARNVREMTAKLPAIASSVGGPFPEMPAPFPIAPPSWHGGVEQLLPNQLTPI